MFRCCCSREFGTWRSGVLAVVVSLAAAAAIVGAASLLGREFEDGFASRWLTVFSTMLVPFWVAIGLAEGRRARCRPARPENPYRQETQPLDSSSQ